MSEGMGVRAHLLFLKGDKVMAERPFSDISFEQYLNEEKLMGSRCKSCGALFTPPRPICLKCHGTEMEWVEMKGKGKLIAFTSIGVGPQFMIDEGFDRAHPYITGVVELKEGVNVVARIEGLDGNKPKSIKIGTPLTVKFLHRCEGDNQKTFLAFESL